MVTETEKPIDAPPGDSREALLIRQVENKIKQEGHKEAGSGVSFSKLLTAANGKEKLQLGMGWIFAFLAGITIPLLFLFMGDVFDSFNSSPDEARRKVRELMIIMGSIGIGILITGFFQNYFLMTASATIAARMKTDYLRAILNQESAWFDQSNYTELSARITREVDMIKSGIGRWTGVLIYSVSMSLTGLALGYYKGWSLALALTGFCPIVFAGIVVFSTIMQKSSVDSLRAYSQSAGYAEQALSAIRIVVSFGQEKLEIKNYTTFLDKVRLAGRKQGAQAGCSMGFLMFTMYAFYAFAFGIGLVWVEIPFWNHALGRDYTAGDTIAIFFTVLIGLMMLGQAGPALTNIAGGQAAGKTAYEVIDRIP